MGRVRCVRWKRSKQKREISSLFVFRSLSRLLYWQMTACQRGMWCEGMNGWTWERKGREGRMTSAQNWFPANPLAAPLASVSAFPHLSLVATAAAPSRLLEALFRLDSNVQCCACVSVFIWDARGCSPAQVQHLFFCSSTSRPPPPLPHLLHFPSHPAFLCVGFHLTFCQLSGLTVTVLSFIFFLLFAHCSPYTYTKHGVPTLGFFLYIKWANQM